MGYNRYWGGDLDLGLAEGGKRLRLREEQRFLHMHVLGLSGKGKTSFLSSVIRQDILNGQGVCVIDPHGALYDDITAFCVQYRLHKRRRIRIIDPSSPWCMSINPLWVPPGHHVSGTVDANMRAMSAVWGDEDFFKTPRLQRVLQWVCYVLATSGYTLCEAIHLLRSRDASLRDYFIALSGEQACDPIAHHNFAMVGQELASRRPSDFWDQVESSFNRLFAFLATPVVNTIIGQRDRVLDIQGAMDRGEVLLVNLKRADHLGFSRDRARLIGNLLVNAFFNAALGRKADRSRPFYLYIDEAYDYLTKDIESILDQTRKFGLHLVLSHQRIGQLRDKGEAIESGVMEGAQTKVIFGLGRRDAIEMGYDLFAEQFDLERAKERMIRPTAVGQELVSLRSQSATRGQSSAQTNARATATGIARSDMRARAEAIAENESWSEGRSISDGESLALVDSTTAVSAWGSYESLSGDYLTMPDMPVSMSTGTSLSGAAGIASAKARGTNRMASSGSSRGRGISRATTEIEGTSTTRSQSHSESIATTSGTNEALTEGTHEAYRTVYRDLPTATYNLEELKHLASVELSRLSQRQAYVKVPDQPPVKILADLLQPGLARLERIGEALTAIHSSCEYTVEFHVIEQELIERPQRLLLEAETFRREALLAARAREDEVDLEEKDLVS
jgi:hypothetical protein